MNWELLGRLQTKGCQNLNPIYCTDITLAAGTFNTLHRFLDSPPHLSIFGLWVKHGALMATARAQRSYMGYKRVCGMYRVQCLMYSAPREHETFM